MRLVVEGTHRGELGGSPTGNRIAWGRDHDLSLADGEIAEQSANEDWTALLHAVGHTLRDEVGSGDPRCSGYDGAGQSGSHRKSNSMTRRSSSST
jgi:hypothetical protein